MAKIYISPPYHYWNQCAYASDCNETYHCNIYDDELQVFLLASGFEVARGPYRAAGHGSQDLGTQLMYQAVAESNAWKPDLHLITHTNAGGGSAKGSRPMYLSAKGKAIAEKILEYRRKIYPYDCFTVNRTDLYELKTTNAPAVYEELVFHDNTDDVNWFHGNMRLLAEYTARALCDVFGLTFANPYENMVKPETPAETAPETAETLPETPATDREPVDIVVTPAKGKGDINNDGKITAADALAALQASVQKITLTPEQKAAADVNANGDVDAADALQILKESVGK